MATRISATLRDDIANLPSARFGPTRTGGRRLTDMIERLEFVRRRNMPDISLADLMQIIKACEGMPRVNTQHLRSAMYGRIAGDLGERILDMTDAEIIALAESIDLFYDFPDIDWFQFLQDVGHATTRV